MLKKEQMKTILEVRGEIRHCFRHYDERVEQKQHVVPIQTLDYWATQLEKIIAKEVLK